MKQRMNEPVGVSVTKSRPGQLVGLSIDQQGDKIMVTDVFGLFKHNNLPVEIGDELLEVNGLSVMDKEEFARGLKDVQMLLRREWHINVKVKKGVGNVNRLKIEDEEPVETYGTVAKETKKWNDYIDKTAATEGSESEDDSIHLSESDDENEKTTKNEARKSRQPRRKNGRRARSASPFSAFSRAEKRKGKRKTPAQQKAFHESMSDSLSNTTDSTQPLSNDDDTPPRPEERTCQTGRLVDIDENDAVLVSPISPNHESKPPSETAIKSIHGTDHGIRLELDDGKTVSITPEQLMAAVSEHKSLDDSITSLTRNVSNHSVDPPGVWDPNSKPKSKLQEMMDNGKVQKSKPEKSKREKPKSKKGLKSPKRDRPKGKAPRRSSMPPLLPSDSHESLGRDSSHKSTDLSSLRNLLNDSSTPKVSLSALLAQHTDKMSTEKPSSHSSRMSTFSRTCTATKEFMDDLRKAPKPTRRSSMPMFECEPLTRITEDKQDKPQAFKPSKMRSKSPDSLPDETSYHSTHSCMTNLIDPGDLMKIHGFRSKPKFNGATVEVVRKSKGHKGMRWDVRVVSKKHIKNTSFNAKRLISVSRDNLKHFM